MFFRGLSMRSKKISASAIARLNLLLTALFFLCGGLISAHQQLSGRYGIHDPSSIIKDGNTYYTFGTGEGVYCLSSNDMDWWTQSSSVFSSAPAWTLEAVPGGSPNFFWAPAVAYFNGRYHVYYSYSEWGTIDSVIGLATSPSLNNPVWTDRGKVVQSDSAWMATENTDYTDLNCIDPSVLVDDDGRVWLVFGSYSSGIVIRELAPSTGLPLNNTTTHISNSIGGGWGNTEEGAGIYKHNGLYYLMVNDGGCCSGVDSTYHMLVGRSTNPRGPYLDKNGVSLESGGGTLFYESSGRYIGPGHPEIFEENGSFLLSHHYYDGVYNGAPTLGISELIWDADGWPVVLGDWQASYSFDIDGRDDSDVFDATLENGAAVVSNWARGEVLYLTGEQQYVSFPLSVGNARTFATWVKWDGGNAWQRIFDFGTGTSAYMFLTPSANSGKMRFAINAGSGEQILEAPVALPMKQWCHVAVTLETGGKGTLYLDGEPVAEADISIAPWSLLARELYVGKSRFTADPYFAGRIDDFKIFGTALGTADIAALAGVTPPQAPASLSAKGAVSAAQLDWPDNGEYYLTGYNIYRSQSSGVGFALIGNTVESEYLDQSASVGSINYYVVTAVDSFGNQSAFSNEDSCLPPDLTGDYKIDFADFAEIARLWPAEYDINDLAIIAEYWLID